MKKSRNVVWFLSLGSVVVPGIVSSGVYTESDEFVVPNRDWNVSTLEQRIY